MRKISVKQLTPTLPKGLVAFANLLVRIGGAPEKELGQLLLRELKLKPQPTFSELVQWATRPFGQKIQFRLVQGRKWELQVELPAEYEPHSYWLGEVQRVAEEWAVVSHECPDPAHGITGDVFVGVITNGDDSRINHWCRRGLTCPSTYYSI